MRKQRTHFDKAFKENAVKLSLERRNVSKLAQELGIVLSSISLAEKVPTVGGSQFLRTWSRVTK